MSKSQVVICVDKRAMLSGMCIPLHPRNVREFGGLQQALVYQQIAYLSKPIHHEGEKVNAVRMSYTRLQGCIPSVSRRWMIAVVAKLVEQGAVKVIKTKRVNLLAVNADYEFKTQEDEGRQSINVSFPGLLKKLSVIEAILLQQIHIRCVGSDGSVWVIRSCRQLQRRF